MLGVSITNSVWNVIREKLMNLEIAKKELLLLLREWRNNNFKNPSIVQEGAENIEERLVVFDLIYRQGDADDSTRQIETVLDLLTIAPQQYVLPEDIDAMVKLLEADKSELLHALEKHSEYWNSIDYAERKNRVEQYWC